jgi:lycopene cyclase domain-containing protein
MIVLFLSGILPFILSFWRPLKFYQNWPSLIYSIFIILIIFGGWDIFAVFRQHWYFNPDGVWHFKIVNLPLEELLFFIIIPFCCIFTWEAINFIKAKFK